MEKLLVVIMVVLLLVVGGVAYYVGTGHANSGLQKQVNDLITKINELVARVAKDDVQIAELQTQRDTEKALRIEKEKANQVLEAKNAGLIIENTEFKKQIKLMTDIQLAEQIGKWIGQAEVQVALVDKWHFSLTRVGGENTVAIFKDRDTYFSLANNRLEQITNLTVSNQSLEKDLTLSEGQTKIALSGRDDAVKALLESKDTIKDLNKKLRLSFIKNGAIGIGAGIIVTAVVFSLVKK
jgi:hypothetical protein